ncbi:hypothetical protein [Kitasatospora sp. NPDC059571]|uniref:hypothetical protein n=1 Tax=Kitasatospora sp. NPDC059571 TaxID=3346871 RepID=UPI0036B3C926
MATITVLHHSAPGAPARIAAIADEARALGYTNVETTYEPHTGNHVVTGDSPEPDQAPTGR